MKKISALVILLFSLFSSSYAQDTKIESSPAYDNIHNSHLILQHINPINFTSYALLEKPDNDKNGRLFTDKELDIINLNEHTIIIGANQNYIQKIPLKNLNTVFLKK